MPFLKLNGWTINVASAQSARVLKSGAPDRRGRSFRGQIRDGRRFSRTGVEIETAFALHDDAQALQQMLLGRGHFFDFADGLQAATSLQPDYVAPGVTLPILETGAFGQAGCLRIPYAFIGAFFIVDAQLGAEWTVLARRRFSEMETWILSWKGYAWRSDGATFVDGARNDVAGRPSAVGGDGIRVDVVDGIVHIVKDEGTSEDERIDDLMILGFRASDAMLVALTAPVTASVHAFNFPQELVAEGDIFATSKADPFRVVAEVGDIDIVQGRSFAAGRWVNNARILRFSLYPVDPSFALNPVVLGA